MASALSEDEFHRMQMQLIDLRTAKYELESQVKKQEREVQNLRDAAKNSDQELQKAQKALNKSKKAKEVELLLQENDSLQRKLQSQEDEFRMQNQTLMQELTLLVSTNEDLEKQLAASKDGTSAVVSSDTSHLEDEIRRLQAQNAALQKNVSALQGNGEGDDFTDGDLGAPTSQTEVQADPAVLQKMIDDLKISLDTELEEKKIIKADLSEKEDKHSKEVKTLSEEVEKLSEKLKKKQESIVQLQEEKEMSFKDRSVKLEELQGRIDRDQKYYTDQINRLQQEIAKYQNIQEEIKSNCDIEIKQLQNKISQMQQQIDAADIVETQHIKERSNKYEAHIQQLKTQVLKLTENRDNLSAQLQESLQAASQASQNLERTEKDREEQLHAALEANKLAEKRKANLDELAIQYQKDCDKHREQTLAMENDNDSKVKALQHKLEQEQKKNSDLEKLRPVMEEQQSKITALEEKTGWLERRLEETEGSLDKTMDENEVTIATMRSEHEEEVSSLKTSHCTDIEQLTSTFQTDIHTLKEREESQKQTIHVLEEEVNRLKQDVKDGMNDKKVHEKKSHSVLKDLKKQLHAERKRGDKLQERLQEVLSSGSKSIEDLLRSPDRSDTWREDQSSISSWSGGGTLASYSTNYSTMSTSPQSTPMSPSSDLAPVPTPGDTNTLETDNKDLLNRLATIQQEKWDLEEKVRHLETSTAAMANDLIDKSKIIEHYVMESKTDKKHTVTPTDEKLSLKKVLDLVNKSDDQALRDMNKKLQNMLEETLTKNMHLQKDLETMSQELVRLSKYPVQQQQLQSDSQPSNSRNIPTTLDKHSTANGAVS